MWLGQEVKCGGERKHRADHSPVAECGGFPPRCDGCGAVLAVSCVLLHVGGVWEGVVGWLNVCVVGWWSATTAGSAW